MVINAVWNAYKLLCVNEHDWRLMDINGNLRWWSNELNAVKPDETEQKKTFTHDYSNHKSTSIFKCIVR